MERASAGRPNLNPQAGFKAWENIVIPDPDPYRVIQVAQGAAPGSSGNWCDQIHAQGPSQRGGALGPSAACGSRQQVCARTPLEDLPRHPEVQLKELSIGTFLYAGLFTTEGVGLLLRKRWAEFFTIITTACLIPLEIYELSRHITAAKAIVALVNVLIVWYLAWRVQSR